MIKASFSLPPRPAAANPDDAPWKFESEVSGLTRRIAPHPVPIVVIGSSTFTLWFTIDADLGGLGIVNHGFGGCTISDCIHFLPVLITPYAPRLVVLCAGDNDLADGKSGAQVQNDFDRFARLALATLPGAKIVFVSIKPSVARWNLYPAQTEVNEHVRQRSLHEASIGFIDIRPVMLGPDGRPRPGLFLDDGLHLSPAGYAAWANVFGPYLRVELAAASRPSILLPP